MNSSGSRVVDDGVWAVEGDVSNFELNFVEKFDLLCLALRSAVVSCFFFWKFQTLFLIGTICLFDWCELDFDHVTRRWDSALIGWFL